MSGSAICFTQNPKITAASRNTHMTGKEKTSAANPCQVIAADLNVSDCGESEAIGNSSPFSLKSA